MVNRQPQRLRRRSLSEGQGGALRRHWPEDRGYLHPIFSLRHHHHHAVDVVDGPAWPCGGATWTTPLPRWTAERTTGLWRWTCGGHLLSGHVRPLIEVARTHTRRPLIDRPAGDLSTTGGRCPRIQPCCPHRGLPEPVQAGARGKVHRPPCALAVRPRFRQTTSRRSHAASPVRPRRRLTLKAGRRSCLTTVGRSSDMNPPANDRMRII